MSEPVSRAVLELARLRRYGTSPAAGMPVAAMEDTAESAGRRVHVVARADGVPVLVLGWVGPEPVASTLAPRLSRRRLTVGVIKAFLVVDALLHDPHHPRAVVTTVEAVAVIDRLAGRPTHTFVVPAVEETLPRAGLLVQVTGGWALGPVCSAWDAHTREVVGTAVKRLHDHPGWREVAAGG